MAGHGAGGRRASTSRAAAPRVEAETNENDDLAAAAAPSSSSVVGGPAALPFMLPPRSPLAAIADPGRNPRSAPVTPKSLAGTPRAAACAAGSGVRDRTSSIGTSSRRVFDLRDLAAAEVPAEVPHFELDEDPAFWKDRNVQVLIRIRPINAAESTANGQRRCLVQDSSKTLSWTGHPDTMFTFDHVACETISQEKLFRVVGLPMVENCMSGYNGCLFAYGQTGSGKTYTMMGELSKLDNELSKDSGLTPRIFEYLFARIKEEEERRREDKLKYICKCSFLEIYNEQITDLLEPSSTNLQIREDIKKGVYVENLMECYVSSVKDVMMLLLQGVANRKMAATNMNSESSRSHSVFTCVIESRWERDSMTHLRFGRLNLVDLAGSERQKSSGAEGERLKEAANINRSLSTLGLVIMTLVDVANGKNRHVPYRDSRLTFLLQDSLGGNSKTTIVANVSPSICSSSETLSTLKFAQRAKLIQNNAKVNEDASGDVMSLQRQIEDLKDQLTCLKKQQNMPGSPSFKLLKSGYGNEFNSLHGVDDQSACDLELLKQKVIHLEDVLVGSLRREKSAETEIRKLECEIKRLNRLVNLMESDTRHLRTTVKLRDEKIRRLELLADNQISSDGYLMDENAAMFQEIQLLQEQINDNSQLTQFALENKRLIEQVRMLEKFSKQGEREMLLTEISLLRNHFLHILEQKYARPPKNMEAQGDVTIKELETCRKELDACLENNVLLAREVNKLRCELKQYQKCGTGQVAPEVVESSVIPGINQKQHDQAGWCGSYLASIDVERQFVDVGITTDITESLELTPPSEVYSENQDSPSRLHFSDPEICDLKNSTKVPEYNSSHNLLDKGIILSGQLENECGLNSVQNDEISLVKENAEKMYGHDEISVYRQNEILHSSEQLLQDELTHIKSLNEGLKEKLNIMAEESTKLSEIIVAKDVEIATLSEEWESAIVDLTSFLTDGCSSLDDAYQNIDNMISSFPYNNHSVSEHVEKAMKVSIEKEKIISRLQIELQAAQRMGREVKEKLHILRGATLAITEAQLLDNDESQESLKLLDLLRQKDCTVQELNDNVKQKSCLFAEATEGYSRHECHLPDNVGTVAEISHNRDGSEVNQANTHYQAKLEDVLHLVEDKSNKVLALFSNFEEAQETMEEAETMLSSLLKANEELKLEKDSCRQAVELLFAERTSLINDLQELEASNSFTAQRYDKLHEQVNGCVAEMTNLATIIKESFHQVQRVTTVELFAFCSEVISFGQDLRKWIYESRSYLVNMGALLEEQGNSYAEQIRRTNSSTYAGVSQQVESCSRQLGGMNGDIFPGTYMVVDGKEKASVHVVPFGSNAELEDTNVERTFDMDYASLRREFDRKSDVAEGLSFDLKLLQESTSQAKDMKDKADEISDALVSVQRELEKKTSAMESILKQQKVLEEELAENGAALLILRSELEHSESLSSELFKENNNLKVMLEEEAMMISETKAMLEDKSKVIEGLEHEILLLNSSEEGRLMSQIKELNDNLKIISIDKGNLEEEILKLTDKLEMAVALAEENEAASIEARQAAEISKVYAEEKEEEVRILERSVEELESTITVLEEEVCNLKEEVRSYQIYKKSEAEQAQEMFIVDSTSKCDATEQLCPGRCQLEKRLKAEIIAHQDARRKIECLTMEASCKDEEVRQYKEHIAELVLHSEAQSLLFQEKYQEMEHMISKQKFGLHESNPDTGHTKFEKPSGRTRGSGSPFRCISSIVQQMNSEKDQEISVARQRIEELEGLVCNKQKEICMLTSRLAAVDSMTHDIIRELLGVKLDMTNYANMLDQEELQKLLMASQQQIEQSKAKDVELDMLKEQFDHLIQERDSLFDDMDQRKADLLESQLLIEQLEQREQMLEAQNGILQMEKDNLQQRIMEMDEEIQLLVGSNQAIAETTFQMGSNHRSANSEFSRRLAQSDMLLSHARHEHSRLQAAKSSRTRRGSHQ
ncbi:kinesin-like protein KIN-12E isoform X2 [Oryza glaberrima]|uniref:kinesin-like protein KIN-12E isoform X2 n=1 Tax=Oryza glaberrima TaxID=4538 RepID=UPI00224C31F0|nr:kinesin-like protein KIN-12E isoform X2 [Oryza glaberrima]